MPLRYRKDFCSKNKCKLVITADKDKCLLIYTQNNWNIIEKNCQIYRHIIKKQDLSKD